MLDVIIAGGGPAGLSAALMLGRARRRVLTCDTDQPRNAGSLAVHGFFSRDGIAPEDLRRIGHEQLRPYETVISRSVEVVDAARDGNDFAVTLADVAHERAHILSLATGMVDELPSISGLQELWGTSVLQCPSRHGWEVRDQPLAVFGQGEDGLYGYSCFSAGAASLCSAPTDRPIWVRKSGDYSPSRISPCVRNESSGLRESLARRFESLSSVGTR